MRIETGHFQLSFSQEDAKFAQRISAEIERLYMQITTEFAIPDPGTRYQFMLCRDVGEYLRETGKDKDCYELWMVGWADYSQKKLCILSPHVVTDRAEREMEQVIVHEITHIALDSLGNPEDMNICLAEGIAVSYADQIDVREIADQEPPSFWNIYEEPGFYEYSGYQYSGIYVRHLLRLYGTEFFKELYTGRRDIRRYITPDFEKEALQAFMKENSGKRECKK